MKAVCIMPLQFLSVCHRFKQQEVLHDVLLKVERGDCYGLLGHNGAGKTTLLRIALGLIRPRSGYIAVDNFNIHTFPREAGSRLGGLIEYPSFNGTWNGLKNLCVWARLQGFDHKQSMAEAKRVIKLVGLEGNDENTEPKKVRDYSQGMKQRLGIAQALMGNPAYILLDEPLNGLDPQAIVEMRSLIRRLTEEEGVAVVISSHQLGEIAGLCNRIAILREGVLLVEEPIGRLLATENKLYRLSVASGPSPAKDFLDASNIPCELEESSSQNDESTFLVDLRHKKPAELTRHLLDKEIDLLALTPCDPSLEEVYLSIDSQAEKDQTSSSPKVKQSPAPALARPHTLRAPKWAFLRGVHYELTRLLSGPRIIWAFVLPALFAGISISVMHGEAVTNTEKVGQEVFSSTQMTAFDGIGKGLSAGLPILMVLMAGLASQSIAGEHTKGTLRYLLLRPIGRRQISFSKFTSLILIGMASYALLVFSSLCVSSYFFDFTDLAEILPNGKLFPLVSKEEMFLYLRPVLWLPILPLLAYTSIGFALGSWIKNNVGALTTTLGAILIFDLGRVFIPGEEYVGCLPSAHLPSPFGGHSFLRFYGDMVQGVSNATSPHANLSIMTPLVWLVLAMVLATAALKRKAG